MAGQAMAAHGGIVRGLYLAAMAIFVLTVGIGILNGLDAVEFSQDWLLTHVHSGTLGWITLAVVATAFVYFGVADRRLAIGLGVLIPVYVACFASGILSARAIGGVLLLAAVLWLFAWAWQTYLASERSLPGLALALGLTTFTYGAVIGVLLQVQFALGTAWLTGDAIGAHAAAMAFGYLVLVAMGVIEWRLKGTRGLPRGGIVQIGALFAGGLILSVGLLAGAGQAAGGLYLLTQLVAVGLFVARVWPVSLRVEWMETGPGRHLGAASIWVVGAVGLLMYLIALFISKNGDVNAIPRGPLIAADHSVFLGVMTNLVIAQVATLSAGLAARFRAADHLVFWGVNAGLAIFVVGLISEQALIKRVGAPLMGVSILVALGVLALRLWGATSSDADVTEASTATAG